MTSIQWLTLTLVATALFWVPYVLDRFLRVGIWGSITNPDDEELKKQSPWAKRARLAHYNAAENLVVFAPLVLIAHELGVGGAGSLSATAAMVYFFARLGHYLTAAAAIPVARTLCFLAGFGAQLAIAIGILG